MSKMKYWNGSVWIPISSGNSDTLEGNTLAQVRSGTTKTDVGLSNVVNVLQESKASADAHKAEEATLTDYAHVQTGVISLTLLSANWVGSEAPYTQTLTATGITAGEVGSVDVDFSGVALYADQTAIADAWGNVHRVVASALNEITVYINTLPTVNIPFTVKVVRG